MSRHRFHRSRLSVLLSALIAALPATAAPPGPAGSADPTAAGQEETLVAGSGMDSRATREELSQILRGLPPETAMVLKLDPTLLENRSYLAAYPTLAAFLAAHAEVAHHPQFYLAHVGMPDLGEPPSPATRMTMDILGGLAGLSVFFAVSGVLAWLVKTLIAQRRWSRLSRVQTEVHNKLLDRFVSNEDLLAYIQTPAGRRFLESAPIPLADGRPTLSAPVGRIFWSVQAGVVIAAAGVGLQLISHGLPAEAATPIFALGLFAIAIGGGFVLAALVSYVISRKLGLWSAPPTALGEDRSAGA